jgi:hypothetical protein
MDRGGHNKKKIPMPRLRILRRCFKNNAKAKDISKNEGP